MVGATGIEPVATAMSGQCSTAELRAHRLLIAGRKPALGSAEGRSSTLLQARLASARRVTRLVSRAISSGMDDHSGPARPRGPGLPAAGAADRCRWWWPRRTADRSIPRVPRPGGGSPCRAAPGRRRLRRRTVQRRPRARHAIPGGRFPRSYVDANREPYELDPGMFEGPLAAAAQSPDHSRRRRARHDSACRCQRRGDLPRPRAVGNHRAAGSKPAGGPTTPPFRCWSSRPTARFGGALLIDAHSMPSSASNLGARDRDGRVDIVLGDNHGESCAPDLVASAGSWFRARGLQVHRNQPYAGGFTTQCYGRPSLARHALQIEINRDLYMDETRHERLPTGRGVRQA